MPQVHDCMLAEREREWERESKIILFLGPRIQNDLHQGVGFFFPLLLKFLYWLAGVGNRYIHASINTERRKGCLIYSLIYCDNGPRAFVVLSKGLPPLPRPLPPPPPPNLVAMYNKQGILRTYFKAVPQRIWL